MAADAFPRLKPTPLPAIAPVPEDVAEGRLKAVYESTKRGLGVPWMGVVAMAFARYPTFYEVLWSGLEPIGRDPDIHRCLPGPAQSGRKAGEPATTGTACQRRQRPRLSSRRDRRDLWRDRHVFERQHALCAYGDARAAEARKAQSFHQYHRRRARCSWSRITPTRKCRHSSSK